MTEKKEASRAKETKKKEGRQHKERNRKGQEQAQKNGTEKKPGEESQGLDLESEDEEAKRDLEKNKEGETKDWESISGAADVLDEVKDVREELTILRAVLAQQQHVWQDLVGHDSQREDARGPTYTLHEVEEMINITDSIQKSVSLNAPYLTTIANWTRCTRS